MADFIQPIAENPHRPLVLDQPFPRRKPVRGDVPDADKTPLRNPHEACAFCRRDVDTEWKLDAWRWKEHREPIWTATLGWMPGERCPGGGRPVATPLRRKR